jgi:hypothetical protein
MPAIQVHMEASVKNLKQLLKSFMSETLKKGDQEELLDACAKLELVKAPEKRPVKTLEDYNGMQT